MKGVYKCMLCGYENSAENFGLDIDVSKASAYDLGTKIVMSENGFVYTSGLYCPGFYIRGLHACPDGSIGIAYFAGFKMEENEEVKSEND